MNTTTNSTKRTPDITAMIDNTKLTLTFKNGEQHDIDATELSDEVRHRAMMHGLKQKLVDAAAISRNPYTGGSASIDTKIDSVLEVMQRLIAGQWNKTREGGGTKGGLLFRALVEMYSGRKTPEQITEFLATKTDKEKAALRTSAKIAAIIETLRDRDDADDDGADEMLAELDD